MTHERFNLWRAAAGWAAVALIGWFVFPAPLGRLSMLVTAFAGICVWAWLSQLADAERRRSDELQRVTELLEEAMAREAQTGAARRRRPGDSSGA